MNQPVENKIVGLPPEPDNLGMQLLSVQEGCWDIDAGSENEGEGVVIGEGTLVQHLLVKGKGS